jgi:excinuclease ABC subunit A
MPTHKDTFVLAQRVKLARELARTASRRTIYILDEPTIGLHVADIDRLLQVLQHLVVLGNSVIVIEHNLEVVKCADWIIDLGPGAGDAGGQVIAQGTPKDITENAQSLTGFYLKRLLFEDEAGIYASQPSERAA